MGSNMFLLVTDVIWEFAETFHKDHRALLCIGKCFVLLVTTMSQCEFIMGLADLTGELMRNAINSLATGNTEVKLLLNLMDLFHNISSSGLLLSVGAFTNFCRSIRQVGEERDSKGSWWQG